MALVITMHPQMKSTQTAALTLSRPQPQLWNENNDALPQSTLKRAHAGNTAMETAGAQLITHSTVID